MIIFHTSEASPLGIPRAPERPYLARKMYTWAWDYTVIVGDGGDCLQVPGYDVVYDVIMVPEQLRSQLVIIYEATLHGNMNGLHGNI